jgi:hypothetical protein
MVVGWSGLAGQVRGSIFVNAARFIYIATDPLVELGPVARRASRKQHPVTTHHADHNLHTTYRASLNLGVGHLHLKKRFGMGVARSMLSD